MRLTIIKDDKTVIKDLVAATVTDVSYIPTNVHAVQWYDSKGEVEYNDGTANLEITELGIYAQASTDHQTAIDADAASGRLNIYRWRVCRAAPELKAWRCAQAFPRLAR